MEIKNFLCSILFNDHFIGFVVGVLTALLYDCIKRQCYLRRNRGVPVFHLDKCTTFVDGGDDRVFKITSRTNSFITSEINFSYNPKSQYAGLVFIPSNSFFKKYVKNNCKIEFDISSSNIKDTTLEFKSNTSNEKNKLFGVYNISLDKIHHVILLKNICSDLSLWEDITEIIFLIKKYNASSIGTLRIENIRISN